MKSFQSSGLEHIANEIRRLDRSRRYRFGAFELSTLPTRLTRSGEIITLQPQPARALKLLIEHRGKIVTREMLRDHLWGEGTFLDHEQGINFALRKIRIALGDSPSVPCFIETVPRLGYRFVAAVDEIVERRDLRQEIVRADSASQESNLELPKRLGMLGRRPASSGFGRHRKAGGRRCRSRR